MSISLNTQCLHLKTIQCLKTCHDHFSFFLSRYSLEIDEQHDIVMEEFNTGWAARAASNPNDEIIKSGVNPDDIRKWNVLQNLQDRNETLFYKYDN